MAEAQAYEQDQPELPPPGSRWGAGARSVLPYLTKSLQARPAHGSEARDPAAARENPSRADDKAHHPAA